MKKIALRDRSNKYPTAHDDRSITSLTSSESSSWLYKYYSYYCIKKQLYRRFYIIILVFIVLFYLFYLISIDLNYNDIQKRRSSPLHDQTIPWNYDISHLWLNYEKELEHKQKQKDDIHEDIEVNGMPSSSMLLSSSSTSLKVYSRQSKPSYMILLTNHGWNQPNQLLSKLLYSRCIRTTELIKSIIDHSHFHPTAYEEIMNGKRNIDPNIRYYIILDIDTCFETNYPYSGKGYIGNSDTNGYRFRGYFKKYRSCYSMDTTCSKQYINHELYNTPFFINSTLSDNNNNPNPNNRLLLFECRGSGLPSNFRTYYNPNHLSLITLSSTQNIILNGSSDQGLVPPSRNVISLNDERHKNIIMSYMNHYKNQNCSDATMIEKKEFFISFVGNTKRKKKVKIGDTIRQELLQYHNMSDSILISDTKHVNKYTSLSYLDIMISSEYCLIPRGENLFSYRFTEVLSTGCIPVLISNDEKWLLPYIQPQIVNWNECVIYMNHTNTVNMISILKSISYQQRCIMHYKCYHIYSKYMSNTDQVIRGIINGIESLVE